MKTRNWYMSAQRRVEKSKELSKHKDTILYDWHDDEHWKWVAISSVAEIMGWVREQKRGQNAEG